MKLLDYFEAMRLAHDDYLPLNVEQRAALEHDYSTPLWIIAGPGTGKTHTLVWLVLKRIIVDGVEPSRVFLTTFTRKAAAELVTRLIENQRKLVNVGLYEAEEVDVSLFNIGTLHSLCSRILHDKRYNPTLRMRVLEDELTQQFFIRRTHNPLLYCEDLSFWTRFHLAKSIGRRLHVPTLGERAQALCTLFNRITESNGSLEEIRASGDPELIQLVDGYRQYQLDLAEYHRTDQAHLQRHFLDFLGTVDGKEWLGRGFTVVVDEYQDTNPIQEAIYFQLRPIQRNKSPSQAGRGAIETKYFSKPS